MQTTRSYKAMKIGIAVAIIGIIYHFVDAIVYKTSIHTINALSMIIMVIGSILCLLPLIFGNFKKPKEEKVEKKVEKKECRIIEKDDKSSKMELVYEEYDFSLPLLSGHVNVVKGLSKDEIPPPGPKHFSCDVSPKFKELGLNCRGKATGPMKFNVYYVQCNNDFPKLLKELGGDLDDALVSQHQASEFFINYARHYCKYPLERYPTRYLVKKGDDYFLIDLWYTTGVFSHKVHLEVSPLKTLVEKREPLELYFIVPKKKQFR